jgi:hypothetical protein
MLQNGVAYSTTPQVSSAGAMLMRDGVGPGIFPVLPAGATSGGTTRQVIMSGAAPGGETRVSDHVMTFTTNAGEGAAAPAGTRTMIVIAPPSNEAPPQPKQ